MAELESMRRQSMATSDEKDRSLYNVTRHMRHYNYRRVDSNTGGIGPKGWQTTQATKQRMMHLFRDNFQRGMIRLYSQPLVAEMAGVVQDGTTIQSMGRDKDDRVIAAALACIAWEDMRIGLVQNRIMRPVANESGDEHLPAPVENAATRAIARYMTTVGLR